MSKWLQADIIAALRTEISDDLMGKLVAGFKPLVGVLDNTNLNFQVPQERILVSTFQFFKDSALLVNPADYSFLDNTGGFSASGQLQMVAAPSPGNDLKVTFNFVWYTDIELDHFLNRAGNGFGLTTYHTDATSLGEVIDPTTLPSDIEEGMKPAILMMAGYRAANALASRFGTKYDTSASDQTFSPSQMATIYDTMATRLKKDSKDARNDMYQSAGRQFRPYATRVGYRLRSWVPWR